MRHVEVLDTKHLRELIQLFHSEGLGEDVSNMWIGTNISEFDFTAKDPVAHKMIVNLYVIGTSMDNKVLCQLHATDVVTVDRDLIGNFNL